MRYADIIDQGLHFEGTCCNDCAMLICVGDNGGLGDDFDVLTFEDTCATWDIAVGDECGWGTSKCAVCGTTDHGDRHSVIMVDRHLFTTNTYEV